MRCNYAIWFVCFSLLLDQHLLGAPSSPILRPSDVVFMYQSGRETYEAYGATVLAWGGRPTPQSIQAAKGVKFFGSVGMVTEFARYYERFPDTYEQGLCRDIHGHPVKVPWLTDHQHQGVPYWWCCTRQPLFRQYLQERVEGTVRAGADGVHIDDHMGSAGGLWLGLCFCDRCNMGFRGHLRALPKETLSKHGISHPETFDYKDVLLRWMEEDPKRERKVTGHPLWQEWTIYQCRSSAAFMETLRGVAEKSAGRVVPMGANAGLLWPRHLSDYRTLDLFSAETDHHASGKRFTDLPLVAYRMADAVGRPYASTASGQDWAFIKESNRSGLVRGWIALSYAAGHRLMAPHRQWCYTPEKGTHWYQGPEEDYAPLYQFVRRHADLLDGYQNHANVGVVLPYGSYVKNPRPWFDLCNRLAEVNLSYRILLAGDAIVDHPLTETDWQSCQAWLVPDRDGLLPNDRKLVERHLDDAGVFKTLEQALEKLRPSVRVESSATVRVLPRIKPGSAVVHLLNYDYDEARDDVRTIREVKLHMDLKALGVDGVAKARLVRPEGEDLDMEISDGRVMVPELGLWALVVVGG